MDYSLWNILVEEAGIAMYIIIAFSVIAVAVAIERVVVQWRFTERARMLADTVGRCLSRGALEDGRSACERSRSPLADVFLVGYSRLGRTTREHLNNAVHRERLRVGQDLKKRLWILGTIGATAPFVGLFGTVVGIMDAFAGMSAAGGGGGLDVVSGPISEALWATAAGIAVGVEGVIIYNFLNQRLGRISVEMKLLVDEFLELLDEHGPEDERHGAPVPEPPPRGEGPPSEPSEESKEGGRGAREAA
jgi:biopolymer transport protein ExbB/TolQ